MHEAAPAASPGAKLARLFGEFFKISLFVVGGGYAILAVADRVFARLKWTDEGEIVGQLPILQTVPGLIAGNVAIYVGHKLAGRLGAAVALLAVALPSFAIFLAVAVGFACLPVGHPLVEGALFGSRCAITGILAATTLTAWRKNVCGVYGHFAVFAAAFALMAGHVNPALVLVAAMLCGLGLEFRGARTLSVGVIPLVFLKYGLLCFGGGFVLVPMYIDEFVGPDAPLLQLSAEEFSNVIALTQLTPGPVSVNGATFFGYCLGGVFGAALATACLLLPSWFLLVWALRSLEKWKASRVVKGVLRGVKPATAGLLVTAAYAFAGMSAWNAHGISVCGTALSLASGVVFARTRFPPAALIFACAAAGLLLRLAGCP